MKNRNGRCRYYGVEYNWVMRGAPSPHGQRFGFLKTALPYCEHELSPAPRATVLRRVTTPSVLGCGGELGKCAVRDPVG